MNIFLHALRCLRAAFRMCRERGAFGDPSANVQNPRGDGQREDGRGGYAGRARRLCGENGSKIGRGGGAECSRRIGKTAAARARSALFPRISLLKQRNSKSIPPKYTPAARQSGFTRCRRDFGSSPLQDKRNHRMKRKTARTDIR